MISYGILFAVAFGWIGIFGTQQAFTGIAQRCDEARADKKGAPQLLAFTWAVVVCFWVSFAFYAMMMSFEMYFACCHRLIQSKREKKEDARLKKLAAELDAEIEEEAAQEEEEAELKAEAAAKLKKELGENGDGIGSDDDVGNKEEVDDL